MTIDVQIEGVVSDITSMNVAGVNIKGVEDIQENAEATLPLFQPRPDGFITDMEFERVSFGSDGTAKMNLTYTLNYRYLHSKIGSGGGLLSTYGGLVKKLALILEKIFAYDAETDAVDVTLQSISDIGPLPDPAGNQYHGVDISLRVLEFAQ